MVRNPDFEISVDSGLFFPDSWYFEGNPTLETIYDEKSPSGSAHLKISDRNAKSNGIYQDLKIDFSDFDPRRHITVRWFNKFDSTARAIIAEPHQETYTMKEV